MKEWQERQEQKVVTPQKELSEIPEDGYAIEILTESDEQREVVDTEEKISEHHPPAGRPEWDLLTMEQISSIEDLAVRTQILEYKIYIEKIKQDLIPDYATRDQFDLFKKEIQENLLDIDGRLNDLKESVSETIVETLCARVRRGV